MNPVLSDEASLIFPNRGFSVRRETFLSGQTKCAASLTVWGDDWFISSRAISFDIVYVSSQWYPLTLWSLRRFSFPSVLLPFPFFHLIYGARYFFAFLSILCNCCTVCFERLKNCRLISKETRFQWRDTDLFTFPARRSLLTMSGTELNSIWSTVFWFLANRNRYWRRQMRL